MKVTPKQYAALLYEMTKDAKGSELKKAVSVFIRFLVRGRASAMLPRIILMYRDHYNRKEDVIDVEMVSAHEISPKVIQELKHLSHGKANLEYESRQDKRVLGGVRIRIGDYMFDDTLKSRLNQLKLKLTR